MHLHNKRLNEKVVGLCFNVVNAFWVDGGFNKFFMVNFMGNWQTQLYKKAGYVQAKHFIFLLFLNWIVVEWLVIIYV